MPDKIVVAISNSFSFLMELKKERNGGGVPAAVQRRSYENNVTWFQFILDSQEDGRLVPKRQQQQRHVTVWHVWQANTVVGKEPESETSDRSYTVRLPRKSPDSIGTEAVIEDVFGMAFKIESSTDYQQFLSSYHRIECQVTGASSVPIGGSPSIYKTLVEVGDAASDQLDVVHIREVLNDVHLFQSGQVDIANNATDGVPSSALLIEY
ncbi:hypothetical protein BOX15_Mlig025766g2 [Macrostomum lignano]|uniref:Uncharacterized protein n=1 Tax=Macrostomum lignano TaxID=282301 RepID=A0A267FV46_9PLAT|nr:hypothetical protein BOX15_Mlig025766g2 [Macrostomum lignano]